MDDTIVVTGPSPQIEDELSDEQMQQMLARAAKRKQESVSLKLADDGNNKQFSFPKLSTGDIAKPYVSTTGDVAQVDSSRLVQEKDRMLANKVRKIEDPVVLKQKKAEVCIYFLITYTHVFAYEENIPNSLLEQSPGTVLVAFLQK